MLWFKIAAKLLELAGMGMLLLGTRWLLSPASYKDDLREAKHVVSLLRWDMLSLGFWLDMLPYRFAVLATHELGIAQRNLNKLRARYERGEFKEDDIKLDGAPKPQSDSPTDRDTSADGLDSGQ